MNLIRSEKLAKKYMLKGGKKLMKFKESGKCG